jgi:hypothetical protein
MKRIIKERRFSSHLSYSSSFSLYSAAGTCRNKRRRQKGAAAARALLLYMIISLFIFFEIFWLAALSYSCRALNRKPLTTATRKEQEQPRKSTTSLYNISVIRYVFLLFLTSPLRVYDVYLDRPAAPMQTRCSMTGRPIYNTR